MKLNIQEIRKQPEGLHFEQALDLAAELCKRNQEILDVKNIQLDQEVLDDDLVLPIENGDIDLAESVADNILLNIPIKVLTAEEEAGQGFVSGNDWQIMTEDEYQAQQAVKKEENSPFAGLQGLFDGDE